MRESKYQGELIKKLKRILPGCVVHKNDPGYQQGFPDLLVLWRDRWACLEVKQSAKAAEQTNQRYFVDTLGEMSFAAFIYPENEDEVLNELQLAFGVGR